MCRDNSDVFPGGFASCARITLMSFLVVLLPAPVFPGGFASCAGISLMSFLVVLLPVPG